MIRGFRTMTLGYLLAVSILLALPGNANSASLFEENFSGPVSSVGQKVPIKGTLSGWVGRYEKGDARVESEALAIPFDGAQLGGAGSLSFLVKRMRMSPKGAYNRTSAYNSVLWLMDEAYNPVFGFYVVWRNGYQKPAQTTIEPIGGISPGPADVWGTTPIGRVVPEGGWLHLVATWDAATGSADLFVDGESLIGRTSFSRDSSDSAERLNNLAATLPKARSIRIGSDPSGSDPSYEALIAHVRIDNVAMTSQEAKTFSDQLLAEYGIKTLPVIASVTDDSFQVPGISGKLVAGDTVTATLVAVPGGKASFDMGDVSGIPMEEVLATEGAPGIPAVDNGTYRGSYTIRPGDDFEDGYIVGRFVSTDNVAATPVASASKWTIDTKPVVTFDIDKKDIPADSAAKARIKLVAKDANGNPVQGRRLKLTLATTDEYTGLVGAGDFGQNVGATVETRWRGETDAWGEVEFDYVSGFAAKTVILSAKDLDSGGVTVDYITSFKEAAIDIALTPPISRAATRRGVQYILKVEASRTELTADGRSRSVIRATLMDPNGNAVSGDPVEFTLSGDNGKIRTIRGTTDSSGVAIGEYTAGKKIGIVVVTATAVLRNVSGNVSIILLSDAPAKIYLKARPETLPADGFSRSDLEVKVTDINDNPNADTKVEFRVDKGGGKLDYADRLTDRFGDATNRYTAGTAPGVATIVATVRSKVPTEAELSKAKNVLFAPYSPEGDEIRVEKWLKKKGDSFAKGDPLVEYTVGRSETVYVLTAPYDGTMGDLFVEYWDDAEVGQTLAIINPAD